MNERRRRTDVKVLPPQDAPELTPDPVPMMCSSTRPPDHYGFSPNHYGFSHTSLIATLSFITIPNFFFLGNEA